MNFKIHLQSPPLAMAGSERKREREKYKNLNILLAKRGF